MATFDFGCVADLCLDLILTGDVVPRFGQEEQLVSGYTLELGSSAAITAAQFAKLGGRVRLLGAVGDDALGGIARDLLVTHGLPLADIVVRRDRPTGLGVALTRADGDRAILTATGALDGIRPEALTAGLAEDCQHWHIGGYFLLDSLRADWRSWAAACQAHGTTVSLDPNWDPHQRWDDVRALLPVIDVLLPNAREAVALAGGGDPLQAAAALSLRGPLVVLKRGADGAAVFAEGECVAAMPGQALTAPLIDTIGAGDNFNAGFLHAWLGGQDLMACVDLGDRCARASLGAVGGYRGQLGGVHALT